MDKRQTFLSLNELFQGRINKVFNFWEETCRFHRIKALETQG